MRSAVLLQSSYAYFAAMRHAIAFLFFFILSSQVLPLKQVGKVLFKSQLTEEVSHADECGDTDEALQQLFFPEFFNGHPVPDTSEYLGTVIRTYIHLSESVPDQHASDIFAPPPNTEFTFS